MRKLLTAVMAASAVAVSLPAMAQSLTDRSERIEQRIDNGVRDGSLTWYEARDLRSRLHNIERLESDYARNGMSSWEYRDLDRRYDALASDLYSQRRDTQYNYRRSYDRDDWY
jgi:hypothetical protein